MQVCALVVASEARPGIEVDVAGPLSVILYLRPEAVAYIQTTVPTVSLPRARFQGA